MATNRADVIRVEAVRLFARQGYEATSMRDIAKAVGVLPGSLYAHIDSKEQLLLEIIERGIEDFSTGIAEAVDPEAPAADQLRAAIAAHVRVIAAGSDQVGIVFHQWRSLQGADRQRVTRKRKQYEQAFTAIVEAGVAGGEFPADLDVRAAVLTVLGALNWVPEWFTSSGQSAEEVAERISALLLGGLLRR